MPVRIESFLSARLHVVPQLVGERIYFISNLSGHLSLYAMYYGGSVPEPLLPPAIALQNPELVEGKSFYVFPKLAKILVMIDRDGDENYQPMLIPLEGGFPEPAFGDFFHQHRVHLGNCDPERNLAYFNAESRLRPVQEAYRGDLSANKLEKLAESEWGANPVGCSEDHTRVLLADGYTLGDMVLSLLEDSQKKVILGKPLDQRKEGESVPPNGLLAGEFAPSGNGLLLISAVFDDQYSLGYLDLARPGELQPVKLTGLAHTGIGEMKGLAHLKSSHYAVAFNIDGCSWLYEGAFNEDKRQMNLRSVLVGEGDLAGGVLERFDYDRDGDRIVLSFSTAVSPTQIYTIEGKERDTIVMHTEERLLGIPEERLSKGEDASFVSFDGTRISARLYLPAESLGFTAPRPLVYYIHGGPQSQERPDFAWFSMPLVQILALEGFAVFVPNARGSTGYGLAYSKRVDRDWGGLDRLDHVHAMTEVLPRDERVDVSRAGVVGRSYGGYMTLTLAARHPELWGAAVDMFGPYDLISFMERLPETWKPYFALAVGDPETDRDLLVERSPRTHIAGISCPLLVIQGQNDPRVVERESRDVVEELRGLGRDVEYLVFDDEGHDVLKLGNRVRCYDAIVGFFSEHLGT
jgi:pimeloyl-ACP methyl ester carboxylesterase